MFVRWSGYAAIPLRLVLGAIFVVHGAQKLASLPAAVKFVAALGLAPGTPWAIVAGLVEVAGGIALLAGLLTRWVALALALEMLAALALVYVPAGVAAAQSAIELRCMLIAGLASLMCSGAQAYALDTRVPALTTLGPPPEVTKAA